MTLQSTFLIAGTGSGSGKTTITLGFFPRDQRFTIQDDIPEIFIFL